MRCIICDNKLLDSELLRKDSQGNHMDTCNNCMGAIWEHTEEFDFIEDVDVALDKGEEKL